MGYIALEKMNNAFNNSKFVSKEHGGSCAYGDHDMDRPVALVQANEPTIMEEAKKLGVQGDFDAACKHPEVIKVVLKDLVAEGKKAGCSALETIIAVALITKPWSPEDKTLTATLKIVPGAIKTVNKKELDAIKKLGIR